MTVRAVLFDIDGTLADSNDLHVRAWIEAFRAHGVDLPPHAIHDQIGKGADLLVPALMPGADAKTAEALGEAHGAVFKAKYIDEVRPFPGARDLLMRTHGSGRRVVLASSASGEELEHYLDLLDVRAIVDASTTIDDVQTSKPAPDIFATALERARVAAAEAIAVGDSPYDVQSAGQAGIATVALRSGGFEEAALRKAGAVALYDDVAALLADFDGSPLGGGGARP